MENTRFMQGMEQLKAIDGKVQLINVNRRMKKL